MKPSRSCALYWRSALQSDTPDHFGIATTLNSLAASLLVRNRLVEAEPLTRRVLEILLKLTQSTGHEHPKLRTSIQNYHYILSVMGHTPEQIRARLDEMYRASSIGMDADGQLRSLPVPPGTQTTLTPGHGAPTAPLASAEEHFQRGEECRAREQWDQAIGHFSAAIAVNPEFANAYFKRGNIKLRLGRHADAISDYTAAIRLDPSNSSYVNNRGRAYFESKQYDRAIADYDSALRIDTRFSIAYLNRGLARETTGDHEGALADFGKSVELDPSNMTYRDRFGAANHQRG